MDVALEKLLRVAEAAVKGAVPSCQDDEETITECTSKYPMEKVTQEEIDAVRTAFLAEQIDAERVDKWLSRIFQKFAGNWSTDRIFKASVRV